MTEVLDRSVDEQREGIARISHWIGGRIVPGQSGRSGPVYNPATGEQTAEVDLASVEEVGRRGRRGQGGLRVLAQGVAGEARGADVQHPRARPRAPRGGRARSSPTSTARCSRDALGEVTRGLEVIEFACGIPTLLKGEFSEQASTGIDVYSIRQPLGVVAGITPFNFPAMVPMWMWAPAIACGNTFVLKPSREGPVRVDLDGRAAEGGRPARRRLQRRPRRQGRGRPRARAPGHLGGQLRRLDPDRALRLRDGHEGTASACRRSAARRTT